MKTNIHPTYHHIVVKCTCGATFPTGSTKANIAVDICSQCHPFFTGEMRYVDTMGRVEKFKAKQANAKKVVKKDKKAPKTVAPTSLREMLESAKAK